jgi:hypothetical protein
MPGRHCCMGASPVYLHIDQSESVGKAWCLPDRTDPLVTITTWPWFHERLSSTSRCLLWGITALCSSRAPASARRIRGAKMRLEMAEVLWEEWLWHVDDRAMVQDRKSGEWRSRGGAARREGEDEKQGHGHGHRHIAIRGRGISGCGGFTISSRGMSTSPSF